MENLIVQVRLTKFSTAQHRQIHWITTSGYRDGSTAAISADVFAGEESRQSLLFDTSIFSTRLVHEAKPISHNRLPTIECE